MKNRALLWYRQDLRLHDNEALYEALKWNAEVIPVYVFDPRVYRVISPFGHRRMGAARAQFIIESISSLRASWQSLGSDLIVRIGHPEEVILQLAKEFKTDAVFCNRERTRDEVWVQDRLEQNLWTIGQEMRFTRGKMLYYTQDLPFPVTHTPNNFSTFKKELDRIVKIRQPLPDPYNIIPFSESIDRGPLPTLSDLGFTIPVSNQLFFGGEQEGIKKLKEYIWSPDGLVRYRSKEGTLADSMYSSHFSPWLSQGCISPKMIYHEIKSFESIHGVHDNSNSLINELIRRDYCRLVAKKYGDKIFEKGGITGKALETVKEEDYLFVLWKEGRLGIPLIDAAMNSLPSTGYLSFPLRQACAQFLIHVLKLNWQLGADWYEANLVDYDPASNWVNWLILAGLLPEAQDEKIVGIDYLCKRLDSNGEFIKKWLPVLHQLPAPKVFHPENLDSEEQQLYAVVPGKDYPKPVVNF